MAQQNPKDQKKKPYRPGPDFGGKAEPSSGGIANWGPLITWFLSLFKKQK